MDQPFTGERYIGVLSGKIPTALCQQAAGETPLTTRPCNTLSNAVLCSTAPDAFGSDADAARFATLSQQTKLTRFGTDCYAYAMLAGLSL